MRWRAICGEGGRAVSCTPSAFPRQPVSRRADRHDHHVLEHNRRDREPVLQSCLAKALEVRKTRPALGTPAGNPGQEGLWGPVKKQSGHLLPRSVIEPSRRQRTPVNYRRGERTMRRLLAAGAFLAIVLSSTAGHSKVECPAGGHWCGPGRGCCAPGDKCAPKSGCLGPAQTGVPCGTGNCRPGFHCIIDRGGGRTPAQRCALD